MQQAQKTAGVSRTAPLCFLRESGEVTDAHGEAAHALGARVLLVSRGLCRFARFSPPSVLSKAEADRAALARARAEAPFPKTGDLVARAGADRLIWHWDLGAVETALAGRAERDQPTLAPESLLHRPPTGAWRQARTIDGYEAQAWRDGVLIASLWRRDPFTDGQWATFCAGVDVSLDDPPADAPAPEAPEMLPASALGRMRVTLAPGWAEAERVAWAAAALGVATAAFFGAQTARMDFARAEDVRAAAAIEAAAATDPAGRTLQTELASLDAYRRAFPGDVAFTAAARAIAAARDHGLEPSSWRIDGERFSAEANASVAGSVLSDLAAALERDPLLSEASAELSEDRATVYFEAKVAASSRGTPP